MQVHETSDWRDDGCANNHCSGRVPGHCVMLPWICFDATPQARFPPRFVTATISCSSAFFSSFPARSLQPPARHAVKRKIKKNNARNKTSQRTRKTFFPSAIRLWNTLPVDICQLSPDSFKTISTVSVSFERRTIRPVFIVCTALFLSEVTVYC